MAPSSFSKFELFVAQLRLVAKSPISFGTYGAANLIRGQFGRELFEERPELYQHLFAPPSALPSGLKDPPRPYVLRTRNLDGRSFRAGDEVPFSVHLFDHAWVEAERITLSLNPREESVRRVMVEFLTPTELKGCDGADFGALFARLRDRISSLRALYGEGPLDIDFRGMGERARHVSLVEQSLKQVDRNRTSRASGESHPIGGFIGEAIYEGDLSEFLPYLEAGFWTGVGRQTVWGKGEIRTTILQSQ
ncbi:MAG: CRISPR system precrRNA processing endoribonuclease RAMP protein Cas6 [Acidobacteria bacterium]|nr:CRISPR system precrRNA processing endoribonuclease RAMP protein Cas6 [Acidobacteriota bacterium]